MSFLACSAIPIRVHFNCATWSFSSKHNFWRWAKLTSIFPHHIISLWTASLLWSLCRTLGSINLSLQHSFDLMSSPIYYIFVEPLDKICRDHHQHLDSFLDINWIHDEKYHPCPRWFVLSSTTLMPPLQHKLVRVLCYTLSSLLSSLCS